MWARKGTRPWQGWPVTRKLLDMVYYIRGGEEDVHVVPTRGGGCSDAILMSPGCIRYKPMLEYKTRYLTHGGDLTLVWVSWGLREPHANLVQSPSIRHWRKQDI